MLLPCSCFSLVADLIADLLFVSGYQGWQPEVKASIGSSHLESGDLQSDLDAIQSMQSFMADGVGDEGDDVAMLGAFGGDDESDSASSDDGD